MQGWKFFTKAKQWENDPAILVTSEFSKDSGWNCNNDNSELEESDIMHVGIKAVEGEGRREGLYIRWGQSSPFITFNFTIKGGLFGLVTHFTARKSPRKCDPTMRTGKAASLAEAFGIRLLGRLLSRERQTYITTATVSGKF